MGAYQKINDRPRNFRQRSGARERLPLSTDNIVALPRFVSASKRPVSDAKDPAPAWTQDKQQSRKDRTSYYRMVRGKLQRRVDYKRIS